MPSHIDVTVSQSPQPSVYLRMCHARHRYATRGTLPQNSLAIPSMFALPYEPPRERRWVPSATVPIVSPGDVTVREQVDCLHEYPEAALLADLAGIVESTSGWDMAAQHPRRWLRAYARASWSDWQQLSPRWTSARHLLDREVERVGVATVRGGLDVVLNSLSPRLSYADGAFYMADARAFPIDGRRVNLVPSLIGSDQLLVHADEPGVVSVAYPVGGIGTLGAGPLPRAEDRLAVVMGVARASVLRELATPLTMGEIAAHLRVSPASATRHCDLLEKAGLIRRRRRGKTVRVTRTDAGSELLDLLA